MLVLVAGQGGLPGYLAARLDAAGTPYRIAELEGFPMVGARDPLRFRIETLGTFLETLRGIGATGVCFAGAVRRPPLDPARVDGATMPLVPRMLAALKAGDDAALRTVIGFFEEAGLAVTGAHEIAPELLPGPGALAGSFAPDDADIDRAARAVAAMGAADIGQACVVCRGQVLAVEGAFGTDWMLDSLVRRPDGRGGILYKAPKPGQDRRVDLPVIGPGTVDRAASAGLDGIVIEAGGVMVLDRDEVVARAGARGLFLWARQP